MCLLFETIACQQSQLQHLAWHEQRLNNSRATLFKAHKPVSLQNIQPPKFTKKGLWKCRVLYKQQITGISFEPYQPRKVQSLKLVHSTLRYAHKYEDRTELDTLYAMRGSADDILICKNGLITDTSIANVLFFDGTHWLTPATPLLPGTMRAQLLHLGKIKAAHITQKQLPYFSKVMVINALNPFNEARAFSAATIQLDG